MARTYTILGYGEQLKKMTRKLNKAIVPPFKKGQRIMRDALIAEYWTVPFGARIWRWRQQRFGVGGGPAVKLGTGRRPKYPRYSHSQQAYVAPISVTGMAAQMEGGGRLRKHVFWGKSERTPGLEVPRHPVMDRTLDRLWDTTVDQVSRSFWQFVDREI